MDIRDFKVAASIIAEIETDQFIDRRSEEYKAYKVSEGGQRTYVDKRLQELFPKSYKTMRVSDISISNKVLSKVSKAYKDAPTRMMGNQTDNLNDILDDANFNSVMAEFDRDFNRQRYGLLWVNNIDDKITMHSLKGFESFTKRNRKTGELELVVLNYPDNTITDTGFSDSDGVEQKLAESQDDTSAETITYAMWTKDYHAVWTTREKKGAVTLEKNEVDGNLEGINPLGILPFIYKSKSSSTDLPFLNQLTEQSIVYNILNSDRLTAMAIQGYGQLVMSLPENMSSGFLHSGMTTAITLPIIEGAETQASADYINPNPDLQGMKETINDYAGDVISEHLGDTQAASGQSFSSGLERLIANVDVSDKISSNRTIYADVEKEVVDIIQAYGQLPESDKTLVTIFEKSKVLISDTEVLSNIKTRMEMGLLTKVEAMQIIDPNLTPEQAQGKLDTIDKEKKNNIDSFMGGFNGKESNEAPKVGFNPDKETESEEKS
jgi:hypothetical protein